MDIFALLTLCGPAVHPNTTTALIVAESGGNPYAIGDNTTKRSYFPQTKDQAVSLAYQLIQSGHRIDMGLTQISSPWLSTWNISLNQVFDPCANISIGTSLLADNYQHCEATAMNEKGALWCALSKYNTGTANGGYAYVNRVLAAANVYSELRYVAPAKSSHKHKTNKKIVDYGGLEFKSTVPATITFR